MANTNVFPLEDTLVVDGVTYGEVRGSKFVDFAGLDYFWSTGDYINDFNMPE